MADAEKPLAQWRLAATLPPRQFFGGNNLLRALDHIAALRDLGATVFEFDTDAVYRDDDSQIAQQKDDLIAFRPDAVIGTPNAGYVVQGGRTTKRIRGSQRARNLFLDDLELPAVLYWDHALTQAARYLVEPWPNNPSESQEGALETLKALFGNPRVAHFFSDTGHVRVLEEFGIGSFRESNWYVQEVAKPFVERGLRSGTHEGYSEDVAFFGNLYVANSKSIPYSEDIRIAELRRKALTACAADWCLPAYQAYSDAIADLDAGTKILLRLDRDQSFYWRFLFDELSSVMNGGHRLKILQSCGRPISLFGNFNDPASNDLMPDNFLVRGALPFNEVLADAFHRTRVAIDVANAPFINGFSVKPMVCFAAGGFVLTNPKADLVRALGPIASEIFYRDANELAQKVDHFLSNERQRLELTQEIGTIVRRTYTSEALFAKTLPAVLDHLTTQTGTQRWKSQIRRQGRHARSQMRRWLRR